MDCPHCTSTVTKERTKKTSLGYRTFCCSDCKRTFNERTETPFNFLEYPTDMVLLVVLWRFWDKFVFGWFAGKVFGGGVVFSLAYGVGGGIPFFSLASQQKRGERRG